MWTKCFFFSIILSFRQINCLLCLKLHWVDVPIEMCVLCADFGPFVHFIFIVHWIMKQSYTHTHTRFIYFITNYNVCLWRMAIVECIHMNGEYVDFVWGAHNNFRFVFSTCIAPKWSITKALYTYNSRVHIKPNIENWSTDGADEGIVRKMLLSKCFRVKSVD